MGLDLLNVRSPWNSQIRKHLEAVFRTHVGQMGHTAWVVAEVMGVHLL